ncbi:MAG: polysaccharide biosynthesis protein [Bacillota bacterium]|nr:polysaccharide biosynthesis protein [Bacillota bacterium]
MKSQSFLKGTAILVAAGIATKVLGALFTIPLARLIGAEGVGLLHLASPVFSMALVLCVSGLPVATSKLVAERLARGDPSGARQVLLVCLGLVIPVGMVLSAALYAGAGFISTSVVRDPRAYFPMKYLSPALALAAVSSVLRGYFQGHRTMIPTAASHVVEQVVRLVVGLGLAYAFLPRGAQWAAAGAAAGSSTGAAVGLVMLGVFYLVAAVDRPAPATLRRVPPRRWPGERRRQRTLPGSAAGGTLRQLLSLAGPATVAALTLPLLDVINAVVVPARLQQAGWSVTDATRLYGHLSVMAVGLVALPGVVTSAVATNLVPQVAAADARGERRRARMLARQAIRSALVIGLPASAGLAVLPTQICALLFKDPAGGVPLSSMAFASVFFCLQQTTAGVLNGSGKVLLPAKNGIVGAIAAGAVNYVLTAVPEVGIRGAAVGTGLAFLVTAALNTGAVGRLTGEGIGLLAVGWRALASCALMVPVVGTVSRVLLARTLSNSLSTSAAILAGILVYSLGLVALGELAYREVALIPFIGPRLARALQRAGVLRK